MLVGISTGDDAGVYRLTPDLALVTTVDFFTPVVDDPYTFGQIAAANAMSDIYAMGGAPRTALNIVCWPQTGLPAAMLAEILRGGADKALEAGAVIAGGHSVADEEVKYGMSVTGVINPNRIIRNVGAQAGDVLVLTKALGTGILMTAFKRDQLAEDYYAAAVKSMAELNAPPPPRCSGIGSMQPPTSRALGWWDTRWEWRKAAASPWCSRNPTCPCCPARWRCAGPE